MSEPSGVLTNAALSELAGLLTATRSFEELMQRVADLAARAVPAATTCAITLAQDGHVITVASADALARLLDEQQYELDQGPCLEALHTARVVSAEDLTTEDRWNGYPARAVAHGVRAIYSSPLLVNDTAIGAINMYGERANAFDTEARALIAQLTALAAATITAALRHYDEATLTDHLRSALSSRSVIDQAIGIVIGMQRCGPKEAFDLLRTVSQNRNIPLREVAAELVAKTADGSAPA
jgi:GAF domain-containing protein